MKFSRVHLKFAIFFHNFFLVSSLICSNLVYEKKIVAAEQQVATILNLLHQDEYQVISNQRLLFTRFEELLVDIYELSNENLEHKTALCFAQALSKGANIYRRIATETSLERALLYHHKALLLRKKNLNCYALALAHSLVDLGATHNELKGEENNQQAIDYYLEGLAIYECNEEQNYVASTLHKLGNAYRDFDEKNLIIVLNYLDRALEIYDSLPKDSYSQQEKGKVLFNQGINYHHLGDYTKALFYVYAAKELFEFEGDVTRFSMTLSYLADIYRLLGNENILVAIDYANQALEIQINLFGEENFEVANTLFHLAMAYRDLGRDEDLKQAIVYFNKTLKIQEKILRLNHPSTTKTLYYLRLSCLELKKLKF